MSDFKRDRESPDGLIVTTSIGSANSAGMYDRAVEKVIARLIEARGISNVRHGSVSRATVARACAEVLLDILPPGAEHKRPAGAPPFDQMVALLADGVQGHLARNAGARA